MSETTASADEISTENTMRERAGESRIKLWLVLGANRLVVTGVLAAIVFVAFTGFGLSLEPSFVQRVEATDVMGTLFSTMLSAIITGVTLVVSINQLVISQETGPLGDQRERMSTALDFREYTREIIGTTTPSDPSAFLSALIDASRRNAEAYRDAVADLDDEELRQEVGEYVDSIVGNAETVQDQLEGAQFGTFHVLFAALNYNYSYKVFQAERMKHEYDDVLGDEARTALDDLYTSLSMFGPAREHIKTLYFQWALVNLSQLIIYAAIPALIIAAAMLSFVTSGTFPGLTLGVSDLLWVTAIAFTITTLPFLVFVSYVIRIATVAKRTLAIGPLILRESQR
ncbi:hypothetical protein ACNS7O_04285 [Haloferacaceae archaeon DSL9]